jgi:hypothetical protein
MHAYQQGVKHENNRAITLLEEHLSKRNTLKLTNEGLLLAIKLLKEQQDS